MAEERILGVWVGALFFKEGKVLLLKEQDKQFFLLPGGKQEEGEADIATLEREILEELGVSVHRPAFWAEFVVPTRTMGGSLRFRLYRAELAGSISEDELPRRTEALAWVDSSYADAGVDVGNLFVQEVCPELVRQGLIT